jgi:hypothetical protein
MIGIVLVASLAANVVLIRHDRDAHAIDTRAATEAAPSDIPAQANLDTTSQDARTAREERDILMELIPAITLNVRLEDIEAYLGTVYSGEPIGVAEDPKCIGCVVVSWRSFRFAFDETGRLNKVSSTS